MRFIMKLLSSNSKLILLIHTMKTFIFCISICFLPDYLFSQAGALDTTFSNDGLIITAFTETSDDGFGVCVKPDGKIVVCGKSYTSVEDNYDFALAQYHIDGSLDNSFGGDGKVVMAIGGDVDEAYDIAVQSDGKVIATGITKGDDLSIDIVSARYNLDGSLDTGFGDGGLVIHNFNAEPAYSQSIVVLPDDKILIAGYITELGFRSFTVIKYNSDGSLDETFGTDGISILPYEANNSSNFIDIAVQADGKIVAAGSVNAGDDWDFSVLRLNADGEFDETFSSDGIQTTDFGFIINRDDYANAIAIQPDGKIIVAGYSYEDLGNNDMAIARYNADGMLDNSFSDDGKLMYALSGSNDIIHELIVQPDGKILAVGWSPGPESLEYTILRCNTDGTPDMTFDDDGIVMTDFGLENSTPFSAVLQIDGKLVVAGTTDTGSNDDFSLARYFTGLETDCAMSILSQPLDIDTIAGSDVSFYAGTYSSDFTYQWQTFEDPVWINLTEGGQFENVNDSILFVNDLSLVNDGQEFRCIVESLYCKDTSDIAIVYVVAPTEINNLILQFNYYPNPADDMLTIELAKVINDGLPAYLTEVFIADMTGKVVKYERFFDHMIQFYIGDLLPGFYFVIIQVAGQDKLFPVIIN